MPQARYVILRHDEIESPHFDLMFQTAPDSPLATWRADSWPPTPTTILDRLPDHRPAYLTFEGEIPGARGHVHRIEHGMCEIDPSDSAWKVHLHPSQGEGRSLILEKTSGASWRCTSLGSSKEDI